MRPDNWFFAIVAPEAAKPALAEHVRRLEAGGAGGERRDFALQGGRDVAVLHAGAGRTVESARFWVLIAGARPADAGLTRALAGARSDDELERLCTAPEGAELSFLVIDKEARTLRLVTDRLNVSKVFHAEIDGLHLLSSHLTAFRRQSLTVDPGAVASYVLNGACHNNRTVFQEVALLERASVHEFRPDARHPRAYWAYAPGQAAAAGWQPETAEAALWALVVQAVERAARGKRVLLALSGGYDSAVLLGILGDAVKHPDVVCFSYGHGAPADGSDMAVAARQAGYYGYPHVCVDSYLGDLTGLLDGNAAIGQALRCPSYEIDAFPVAAKQLAPAVDRVALFGDECFGWSSFRMNSADELLGAVGLKAPALLNGLGPGIGAGGVERLHVRLEADYVALQRKAQSFANPDDAKDFLYLDQRLQFNLLPLRTFIAGHWMPVAMPFLDPDILDFMAAVPADHRLDKRLFRQMARRFLPGLFHIPRATAARAAPDFAREIVAARHSLEAAIIERGWKVDGLVGPDDLVRLLDDFCAGAPRGEGGGARAVLKSAAKTLLAKSRFLEERQEWLRRLLYNDYARLPGRWFLLINLLCLADFLADRPPPAPEVARRG